VSATWAVDSKLSHFATVDPSAARAVDSQLSRFDSVDPSEAASRRSSSWHQAQRPEPVPAWAVDAYFSGFRFLASHWHCQYARSARKSGSLTQARRHGPVRFNRQQLALGNEPGPAIPVRVAPPLRAHRISTPDVATNRHDRSSTRHQDEPPVGRIVGSHDERAVFAGAATYFDIITDVRYVMEGSDRP
jgi:hypothetical protein